MLTEERHSYILKKLKEEGIVKSQDIIRELNCSESTVRRDHFTRRCRAPETYPWRRQTGLRFG